MYAADLHDLKLLLTHEAWKGYRWPEFKRWLWKRRENFWIKLARRVPDSFKIRVFFQVVAEATMGEYGETIVPELTAMDAAKRFMDKHQLP